MFKAGNCLAVKNCRHMRRIISALLNRRLARKPGYPIPISAGDFHFPMEKKTALSVISMSKIKLEDIDLPASNDIEKYQEYLKYYESDNGEQKNGASGIARKMSSLQKRRISVHAVENLVGKKNWTDVKKTGKIVISCW